MRRSFLMWIVAVAVMFIGIIKAEAGVDAEFEAAIISVNGDVQIDMKADNNWVQAKVGMRLKVGAKLKTGRGSEADIVYDAEGLNVVNIKSESEIVIRSSEMDLPEGAVLVKFDNLKKGSQFVVKTPIAACAIRGSGMGIEHIAEITEVYAFEDKVYVTGFDKNGTQVSAQVTVPEAWMVQVRGGNITPPSEFDERERGIWDKWVTKVTKGAGSKSDQAGNKKKDLNKIEKDAADENEILDTKDIADKKGGTSPQPEISPSGHDK
ncbi:MAG TPA: hypothetical protein PKY78_00415 [Candidatus Omnitrophota bacterium]|nr:hypothetical protein [Candidatus Omnitrophota bacterium]